MAIENHIIFRQSTCGNLYPIDSQVSAQVYRPLLEILQTGWSISPILAIGNLLWIVTRSSDLAGNQHQVLSLKTLDKLASTLLLASYTILWPNFSCRTPFRWHQSSHIKMLLPSPTLNWMKFLAISQSLKIFLQLHKQTCGTLTCQKLLPFSRYSFTHATHNGRVLISWTLCFS